MLVLGLCKADEAAEESFDWMLKWQPHNGLDLYECFRDKIQLAEIPEAALFKTETDYSGNHVLLVDIYPAAGRWGHVAKVRAMSSKE
ncbi:hypothetical protein OIU76_011443 [Salix suchowensis]|nr:hypothetical protein OIU76_011443 [Salix suchowensis]